LLLCADVDAAGRFIEGEDVAITPPPFRDPDLLLVSARQQLDGLVDARGPGSQLIDAAGGDTARSTIVHDPEESRELVEGSCDGVGGDGLLEHQTEILAVLGEIAEPMPYRVGRLPDPYLSPVRLDNPGGLPLGTDDGAPGLGTPPPRQPREAGALTSLQCEAAILEHGPRRQSARS